LSENVCSAFCERAKASPQTLLDVGGHWHFLEACRAQARLAAKCGHILGIPLFFHFLKHISRQRLLVQTMENGGAELQIFGPKEVICKLYGPRLATDENYMYTVPK